MTQPHHIQRHPKYRNKYKVTNWPAYERSLIKRGDFTLWLSEDVIQSWHEDSNDLVGRPKVYSDLAIETALSLRLLFKLPRRQTEAFLRSLFTLIKVDLAVPDHTTLSLISSSLKIQLKRFGKPDGRVDLIIDSTGLVIHGEGRWIRHKHGKRKRRGWRKLHIGVSHGLIVASDLTDERGCDGVIAPTLITQVTSSERGEKTHDRWSLSSRVTF